MLAFNLTCTEREFFQPSSPRWPKLNESMGDNNWYRSPVTVWFNGSFEQIDYRIDGGDWTMYTTSFRISEEGI